MNPINDKNYNEALDFLYSFVDYERNSTWKYNSDYFDLSRVEQFFSSLGNPHKKGWFVHIAGTNGKGSVAAMIASALIQSGYKTGLYTSPHLLSFHERIKINDSMISKNDVVEGVRRIQKAEKSFDDLTFFEVWTGLAFDHFAHKSVDVSVVEVGIGGILDTTNVILPAVSVITSISLDHIGKLGNTVEKITCEKAGIMKPGIPVVSAPQETRVMRILEKQAKELRTEITSVGSDVQYSKVHNGINYNGINWNIDDIHVPLAGHFQRENAAVALAVLETLATNGYNITPESSRCGIEKVHWPGRLQSLAEKPEVIVDGACNVSAMSAVRDYLLEKKTGGTIVAVFGICGDKEVGQILEIIGQAATHFIFTHADNPRAMDAHDIARLYRKENHVVENDPVRALKRAIVMAGADGLVIVTGSLYLVGEILKYYGKDNAHQ